MIAGAARVLFALKTAEAQAAMLVGIVVPRPNMQEGLGLMLNNPLSGNKNVQVVTNDV